MAATEVSADATSTASSIAGSAVLKSPAESHTGIRRSSASRLRWRDVDLDAGTIRVLEKGNKTSIKPISNELVEILNAACESGNVDCRSDAYVIPNRRAASVQRKERSSKVVWETVREVAERVGITANVHALRRAFAVAFLTSHPGALESLQALMNHSRIDTTQPASAQSFEGHGGRPGSLLGLRVSVVRKRGPYGIRTRAAAVRGRCPRPLDEWAVATAKCTERPSALRAAGAPVRRLRAAWG